jgi:hypothetical protein
VSEDGDVIAGPGRLEAARPAPDPEEATLFDALENRESEEGM